MAGKGIVLGARFEVGVGQAVLEILPDPGGYSSKPPPTGVGGDGGRWLVSELVGPDVFGLPEAGLTSQVGGDLAFCCFLRVEIICCSQAASAKALFSSAFGVLALCSLLFFLSPHFFCAGFVHLPVGSLPCCFG